MRKTNFHLYRDESEKDGSCHGDYTYHGIRFEFTLNRQDDKSYGGRLYRGRITAISPYTAKPMSFIVKHPYAKPKPTRNRVKYLEIRMKSARREKIKECIHKKVVAIYAENAKAFLHMIGNTIRPDTIMPEVAGDLYSLEFVRYQYGKHNNKETLKKKQKKLIELLATLPFVPMAEIKANEVQACMQKASKNDYELLYRFWNYCIYKHYCTGINPVQVPISQVKSSQAKQDSLQKLTRVPAQNLKLLNEQAVSTHDGPSCGVMLMESGISARVACSLFWQDVSWPTDEKAYALVKLERPDVVCAIHDYTRPLLPVSAMTLFARREELLEKYSEEEMSKMPVVSTKSDPEKPLTPSALVQESKRLLMATGITRNKLIQTKESRNDPVSARILAETYKDLLIRVCGVAEGSGTYKYLLGQAIYNDVSSSNYLSFSSPVASRHLYKYLSAAAPKKDYEQTLFKNRNDGYDILHVLPDRSDRCAGMIFDVILQPGEDVVLEAETGITGQVEATPF